MCTAKGSDVGPCICFSFEWLFLKYCWVRRFSQQPCGLFHWGPWGWISDHTWHYCQILCPAHGIIIYNIIWSCVESLIAIRHPGCGSWNPQGNLSAPDRTVPCTVSCKNCTETDTEVGFFHGERPEDHPHRRFCRCERFIRIVLPSRKVHHSSFSESFIMKNKINVLQSCFSNLHQFHWTPTIYQLAEAPSQL